MELPGGLAIIDPRHWRANLPCSSGSNAELTVFLIVGQDRWFELTSQCLLVQDCSNWHPMH